MKRSSLLILLVVLALVSPSFQIRSQGNTQVSLAFVDEAGNVQLVTPGAGQSAALTQDADFKPQGTTVPTHNYTHLRWSPDGNALAFQDTVTGQLYVSVSGNQPQVVASGVAT